MNNWNCHESEQGFPVEVYVKSTSFNSSGIQAKTIMKAYLEAGGYNVITPRYPMGLWHSPEEIFEFKSRGRYERSLIRD